MKYLRQRHNINIKSNQKQKLRNIGYYHGYKGYRFINSASNRISYTDFNELLAIYNFDMHLKTLFYSKVMFIEAALKNYVLEEILNFSKSENLDIIFNKCLTYYKTSALNPRSYKEEYSKRLDLKGKINSALVRDYKNQQKIVNHFFEKDKNIPIWAIFESITLGEFGMFFSCLDKKIKLKISKSLKLPVNFDSDGMLTQYIIYAVKDLRNAVAHNNVIFDTRFCTGNINKRLSSSIEHETQIKNITFKDIEDYIILVAYILRKLNVPKTEIHHFTKDFQNNIENLRSSLPINIYNKIINTGIKNKLTQLSIFVSK